MKNIVIKIKESIWNVIGITYLVSMGVVIFLRQLNAEQALTIEQIRNTPVLSMFGISTICLIALSCRYLIYIILKKRSLINIVLPICMFATIFIISQGLFFSQILHGHPYVLYHVNIVIIGFICAYCVDVKPLPFGGNKNEY